MGKNIISQRRGRGTSTYRSPGHRFKAAIRHLKQTNLEVRGKVTDIFDCPGHTAPLAEVTYDNGDKNIIQAPEGIRVEQDVAINSDKPEVGDCVPLRMIPEGTLIYNIENQPGDGGKFVRCGGTTARVLSRQGDKVLVMLPSKKEKAFHPECRANIGVIAGGGRLEKPLVKAGRNYHKMRAINKLYPIVCGTSMNAVDHPFGTSRSSKKGRPTIARRHAPPGAKVGKIKPRRTGRR
jgi:large subunit ribosomal protein L2